MECLDKNRDASVMASHSKTFPRNKGQEKKDGYINKLTEFSNFTSSTALYKYAFVHGSIV